MAAAQPAPRHMCIYCTKSYQAQSDFITHLNDKHIAQLNNADALSLGLVRHDRCGRVTTPYGSTKHNNNCVARFPALQPQANQIIQHVVEQHHEQQEVEAQPLIQPPDAQEIGLDYFCGNNLEEYGAAPRSPLDLFIALNSLAVPSLIHRQIATKLEITAATDTICLEYLARPSEELLFRLLTIPKLGIHRSISSTRSRLRRIINFAQPIQSLTDLFQPVVHRMMPPATPGLDDTAVSRLDLKRIDRALATGHIRKSAQILRRECHVAQPTEEVIAEMVRKHPLGPEQPFHDVGHAPPRLVDDSLHILDTIVKSLDHQSSPGISGWTTELIQLCYGRPDENKPFRRFLFELAKQILNGTAPGKSMLCCARLTALQQSPTKLRPIACGEVFYRLIAKFLLKTFPQPNALLTSQLGVGSPAGTEPIIGLLQQAYKHDQEAQYCYSLDFTNAFNSVSRSTIATTTREHAPGFYKLAAWAYNKATPLILSNGTAIKSSQGVRQGDPLGPLLFSMAIRPQLESLRERLPGATIISYLDDVFILSPDPTLLDTIFAAFPNNHPSKLTLNQQKTKRFDLRNLDNGEQQGMNILGSIIGSEATRQQFLDNKVAKTILNLQRLRHLPAQSALILLRLCITPELTHLLRTLDCSDLHQSLAIFDNEIHHLINHLRQVTPDMEFDPIAQRITNLPLSRGGMGLFNTVEVQPIIRRAAEDTAHQQLRAMNLPLPFQLPPPPPPPPPPAPNELARTQKQLLKEHFDQIMVQLFEQLNEDERIQVMDNSSKHGTAWIHAIPTSPHLRLNSLEVAAAIDFRLLSKGSNLPGQCRRCTAPMSIIHPEVCQAIPLNTTSRHNAIIGAIASALKPTNWTQAEPALNNQRNPRRADLRIGNAAAGAALHPTFGLIDLKVKCIFANDTLLARRNIQQVEDISLNTLYHNKCIAALNVTYDETVTRYNNMQIHPRVIPIVISSGGTLHPQALKFFKEMFPNIDQRRRLRAMISIILVRARAQGYQWGH